MQVNFSINIDDKLIERVKKFFTKRNTIIVVLIFTVAVTTVILNGEAIIKKWTFNDGDIIYASRINDNFDTLFAMVNELDGKAGDGAMPVGSVIPFAGTKIPNGWLLCDGTTYNTNSRPELNALRILIDGGFGSGSGSTFNVPDLRGRVIVGVNNMGGESTSLYDDVRDDNTKNWVNTIGRQFGGATHKLVEEEMPRHNHSLEMNFFRFDKTNGSDTINVLTAASSCSCDCAAEDIKIGHSDQQLPNNKTSYIGGVLGQTSNDGASFHIIQPSMALNYIIKY